MNKPYRTRPHCVGGDPYQMLAAWAIDHYQTDDRRAHPRGAAGARPRRLRTSWSS
jgi:hypothetical protein